MFKRETLVKQIQKNSEWDVIVIGGGATGLGVALDSTTRGYKTLLLEQVDFSKGTSSKSTKLLHGGVRYLAQGTIFGLTRRSTDAHIARAALESIVYQTMDVLKAMEADLGISIKELRVDGGATVNNMLMQFQADVLNTVTVRPKVVETTAMGAAFLAGLAVGYWKNPEEIQDIWQIDKHFNPTSERKKIDKNIKDWYRAISSLEYWTKNKKHLKTNQLIEAKTTRYGYTFK